MTPRILQLLQGALVAGAGEGPPPPEGITPGNATEHAYFAFYDDARTFSHNNDGDYLIVAVGTGFDDNTEPSGVTYNGVAMTRIGGVALAAYASWTGSLWGLAAPAAGANNVVITFANEQINFYAVAVSLDGVHQTVSYGTPSTVNNGDDGVSNDVASVAGDLVIDIAFAYWESAAPVWTVGSGQTEIHSGVSPRTLNDVAVIVSFEEATTTTTTMSHTVTNTAQVGSVAVAIKPA